MGIPMYREPSSTEATKNNPVKDACAAARSAIRRQATVRRPVRYGGSAFRSATLRSPLPRPVVDGIERETNGLPRHSETSIVNPALAGDPELGNGLSDLSRREAGQRLLNDAVRYNRPGQRLRIPRNSTLADLNSRSFSARDANNRVEHQEHPSFTPRFAPAIAYHRSPFSDTVRLSPLPRLDAIDGDHLPEVPYMPPLRHFAQQSTSGTNSSIRGAVIDGLGDRQRSVDLEDDHADDAWETLLTTITPDTNLPSADSSFTSASASGANGPRGETSRVTARSIDPLQNSLRSDSATMRMTLDPYAEYPNPCDYLSSLDSDTESDGEITQESFFRRYRRRVRQVDSLRRSYNLQMAVNNPPPIPTFSFAFSDFPGDHRYNNMRHIVDELARRAAGLSRANGQRPSANDESNGTHTTDGPLRQS